MELEASFPGRPEKRLQFLENNPNGNVTVNNGAPAGSYTVVAQFVEGKGGAITDIRPLTKQGYGLEAEVIRTLLKSHKWIPAIQDRRKVKAYPKRPVTFLISESKKKKKKDD